MKDGKTETSSQGVNTGGYAQGNKCPPLGWIHRESIIVREEPGINHSTTDDCQEGEGNPVIPHADVIHNSGAQKPAYKRHKCLEEPEVEGETKDSPVVVYKSGRSSCYRYC